GSPRTGGAVWPRRGCLHVAINIDQIKIAPPADDNGIIADSNGLRCAAATFEMIVRDRPWADGTVGPYFCHFDRVEVDCIGSDLRNASHRVQEGSLVRGDGDKRQVRAGD